MTFSQMGCMGSMGGGNFSSHSIHLGLMGWGSIRDYLEDMTGYKDQ